MATDLIARGKLEYKHGKYEQAVHTFRLASESTTRPEDLISAYDLQIGAMVKTKSLEPALKVAKSMIRSNRRDARGYIRAAQVERLANRHQAAVRWYQQGIKHTSPTGSLYPSLQSGLKKCESQATQATIASRPCDPFATLPIEVARLVLEHLDYRQRVAVLRVSKGWRSFLIAEPCLTETVDFSKAKTKITVTALGACLRRLNKYPSTAHLTNLSDSAAKDLRERLPHWLRRNTLRSFSSTHPLLRFPVSALPEHPLLTSLEVHLALSDCGTILAKCLDLERFHFTEKTHAPPPVSLASSSLCDLRIVKDNNFAYSQINDLQLPNLQSLHLSGFRVPSSPSDWSSLRNLQLRHCILPRGVKLPPTISDLVLIDIQFHGPTRYNALDQLWLPNLVNLRAPLDEWGLRLGEALSLVPAKIETLDVQDQGITEDQTAFFAQMPRLTHLTVRNGRRLSGVFVKDLIEKSSNRLEYIGLFNCENVTPSTATWARVRHQFKVEIKNTLAWADDRDGRRIFT